MGTSKDLRDSPTKVPYIPVDATVTPPVAGQKVAFWDEVNEVWVEGRWMPTDSKKGPKFDFDFAAKDKDYGHYVWYKGNRWYRAPFAPLPKQKIKESI